MVTSVRDGRSSRRDAGSEYLVGSRLLQPIARQVRPPRTRPAHPNVPERIRTRWRFRGQATILYDVPVVESA